MDAAARKTGIDPAELRRRNMIRPEQMPYTNPMDKTYDSGKFEKVLDQALALADWSGFDARARGSRSARGKLRGRGMATFLEWTGGDVFEERVTVDGRRRRRHRDLLGDAGDGAGPRDDATRSSRSTCSACRSRRSASCRATPTAAPASAAPARARSSSAARRCSVAAERTVDEARRSSPASALEAAAGDIEYATACSASPAPTARIGLFELARTAAASGASCSTRRARSPAPTLAQRLPHLRGRDRSRHRRRRGRRATASVNDVGRVVNPMIVRRPARRRRGAGHRPGAVRALRLRPRDAARR